MSARTDHAPERAAPVRTSAAFRLGASIMLWSVAIAIPSGLAVESWVGSAIIESNARTLDALSASMARRMSAGVARWLRDADTLAHSSAFAGAGSTDAQQRVLQGFQASFPDVEWVALLDRTGRVVTEANAGGPGDGPAGEFVDHQRSWTAVVTALRHGSMVDSMAEAGAPGDAGSLPRIRVLEVAVPLTNSGGEVTGALATHIGWQWAERVCEDMHAPGGMELLTVDPAEYLIPGGTAAAAAGAKLSPDIARLGSQVRAQRIRWGDGGDYLISVAPFAPLDGFNGRGWRVYARQSMREIGLTARRARDWTVLSCLAVGAVASLISALAMRRRAGELSRATAAAAGPPA